LANWHIFRCPIVNIAHFTNWFPIDNWPLTSWQLRKSGDNSLGVFDYIRDA
jgi:hypothetical protein